MNKKTKEEKAVYDAAYNEAHKKERAAYGAAYFHTKAGKAATRRKTYKRRNLGFYH